MTDRRLLTCHSFIPPDALARPAIVLIHGAAGHPISHFRRFLPAAVAVRRSLIVPDFDVPAYRGFQRLAGRAGPLAAADAFDDTLRDMLPHDDDVPHKFDLVGFSGGAQFAHRYAMIYPEHVRRLVVASAGWYTFLDRSARFPRGSAASRLSRSHNVRAEMFLRIPILVLVGERDTERDSQLRVSERLDREQGPNRIARGVRWVEQLRAAGTALGIDVDITFELLADTGHSFAEAIERGQFADRVIRFFDRADAVQPAPAMFAGALADVVH